MTVYDLIQTLTKYPADAAVRFRAVIRDEFEIDGVPLAMDFNHELRVSNVTPQDSAPVMWLKYEGDE